jgi:hypothetical protein
LQAKDLQKHANSPAEPNRKPPEPFLEKHFRTLPIHQNNTSEHQIGAHLVHQVTSGSDEPSPHVDPRLIEIINQWPELPEHILQTILTIVESATPTESNRDRLNPGLCKDTTPANTT